MQISRNGWADKIRSDIQRAARTRTWDRDRLDLFLKTDGKCWPSPPVADLFGISRDTVKQHRRKLGLKLNHQECLRDPVYAQWWKAGRANRLRSYEEGMARKREYLRNLLGVRLRLIDLQPQRPKPKKKRCVICGTWWYATPDFFHQKAGGILASGKPRNSYLLNVCLVCPINSKKSRVNKRS